MIKTVSVGGELASSYMVHLPLPPSDVVIWGRHAQDVEKSFRGLGFSVHLALTDNLTKFWPTSRIAFSTYSLPEKVEAFYLAGITAESNILVCLQRAIDRLSPEGVVLVEFCEDVGTPRLPKWRDFWISIGQRLGFDLKARSEKYLVLKVASVQPRWRLALACESDWPKIGALFEACFKQPFDRDLWAWKYAEGRGHAVIAYRNGEVVAHYAGMYRDISLHGQRDWAMQVGDVMVHPSQRAVWTRQGAFFLTCATWAEMYGPLDFGFPAARSMRLAEKLGIYVKAGRVLETRWSCPESTRPRILTRMELVDASGVDIAQEVDNLWSAMARDLDEAAVCVRDWQWLQRRYLNHPSFRYDVVAVRNRISGRLRGILVLRLHPDECELLDVIARLNDVPLLIDQCRRLCALRRRKSLYLWISDSRATHFQVLEGRQREIDLEIPTDGWTGSLRAFELVNRWWLTAGDSDYR